MDFVEVKPAADRQPDLSVPDLSVVVPMYNEAARIGPTLDDLTGTLRGGVPGVTWSEVILVDDGSRDDTIRAVERWLTEKPAGGLARVRLVRHGVNRGKGAAVRTGLKESVGRWRLMMDADNSAAVGEVARLLAVANQTGAGFIAGSRNVGDSRVKSRWSRRLMGRCFHTVLRVLGLAMLRDTQCGFKLYRADLAGAIVRLGAEDRFAFDLEHLLIAKKLGAGIREVGIRWEHRDGGTVRPVRDGLAMLWRAACIRVRHAGRLPESQLELKPAGAPVAAGRD